jgi:DNA replication protein DnaC
VAKEGLEVFLRSFRLPTMAAIWQETVTRAEREDWGYHQLLQQLCESEAQDRRERKMNRLLKESGLPVGKTLGTLDEKLLPPKLRRVLPTLLEGHFVDKAENVIAIGLPGRGKTHLLAAVGRELVLRQLPLRLHYVMSAGALMTPFRRRGNS